MAQHPSIKVLKDTRGLEDIRTYEKPLASERATLLDVLDRVIDKGAVLHGEVAIRVADVDLIYIGLQLLITSIARSETIREQGDSFTKEDQEHIAALEREIKKAERALPRIIEAGSPKKAEKGIAQLVLTLVKLIKELMEREARRRMKKGTLSKLEIEKLGLTFKALDKRLTELRKVFDLEDEDLNIDLGPVGKLL